MKPNAKAVPSRERLIEVLAEHGGSKEGAAKALNVSEPTIRKWIRHRGLEELCRAPGERRVEIALPERVETPVPDDAELEAAARRTLLSVMQDSTAPAKERINAARFCLERQPAPPSENSDELLAAELAAARERAEASIASDKEPPPEVPADMMERWARSER